MVKNIDMWSNSKTTPDQYTPPVVYVNTQVQKHSAVPGIRVSALRITLFSPCVLTCPCP